MLGVIIGVASVVALVGVGQGTTANITDRLGPRHEPADDQPDDPGPDGSTSLDSTTRTRSPSWPVAGVAPEVSTNQIVTAGDETTDNDDRRHDGRLRAVRAFEVWQGRS